MTEETTTDQLAEIDRDMTDIERQVAELVEEVQRADYPQPEPEPQPEPIQVREGRWRTRNGEIKNIRPCEPLRGAYFVWPWTDGFMTYQDNGRHLAAESDNDLVEYLGPIEPDKTQELPDKTQELETKTQELPEYTPPEGWRVVRFGEHLLPGDVWVNEDGTERRSAILHWDAAAVSGGRCIRRIKPEAQPDTEAIEELRSEVAYVQNLLGESRQRVTELEELVASLRTINRGCENAVRDAGKENTAFRNQLEAVKAELASVAADRQRLQIELDAAQQVPADSPEMRQLRADLEQATLGRDTYRDGYDRVLSDLRTIRETTKAETIEAIVEWLVPIRTCGSQALATAVISNLPHIMRSLTGLADEEIE